MVPLSWGNTDDEELFIAQKRELLLALPTGWLWHLIPMGNTLRECTEVHRAPVPGSRAPWGAPGELPWSYFQNLRSTIPRRPLPASSTDLEQRQSWERWAAEPGTHLGFFTCWTFLLFFSPHLFLSSFLLFFSCWHSLSSAQASFLFLFLRSSFSWGEPANLSIPPHSVIR